MIKYRTERLWGEGYRNVAEVMAHEVFELQNTDILDTLSETILSNTNKGKELKKISSVISCKMEDENIENMLDEYYENEELAIEFFKEVLQAIKSITGKDIKYCLWLCDTKEDIINEYDMNKELDNNSFDAYEDSSIILSDLGVGGKLYGYEEYPKPCNI